MKDAISRSTKKCSLMLANLWPEHVPSCIANSYKWYMTFKYWRVRAFWVFFLKCLNRMVDKDSAVFLRTSQSATQGYLQLHKHKKDSQMVLEGGGIILEKAHNSCYWGYNQYTGPLLRLPLNWRIGNIPQYHWDVFLSKYDLDLVIVHISESFMNILFSCL